MDQAAFEILAEDREAVRGLTALTQAEYVNAFQDILSLNMSEAEKAELFKKVLPELTLPFFKTNEGLSSLFYDANRIHDKGEGFGFDPSSVPGFSQDSFGTLMGENGWAVNSRPEAWQDSAAASALLLLLGGALTRSFLNARQENYNKIGGFDGSFQRTTRVPGPKACSWCLRRALDGIQRKSKFHRNCRCTLGIFYDTSKPDKYRNDTIAKYEKDFIDAKKNLSGSFTEEDVLAELRKSFGYR